MAIDEKGRFLKGSTPHNKREFLSCRVAGCDRKDHKGLGYCNKHFSTRRLRIKKGHPHDDISLEKRVPRTEEHIKNNIAYTRNPDFVSKLKGKTWKEILGDKYEEISKKHRESLIGIGKGRISPMRGKKTGKPAWNKGKEHLPLEKNYFWRGGVSKEKYGSGFNASLKERVRNRDNRKCLECGVNEIELGYKLCVHHLDYNKKNNNIDNLVSLCRKCHAKVHWSNEDWRQYFRNTIKENENVNTPSST